MDRYENDKKQQPQRPRFRGELMDAPRGGQRQEGYRRVQGSSRGSQGSQGDYRNRPAQAQTDNGRPRFRGEMQVSSGTRRAAGEREARARAMARRRRQRRQRQMILTGMLITLLVLAGIGMFAGIRWKNNKERQEFAVSGVTAAQSGDYEAAIAAFDQALEKSGGRIGNFETDVLLNRAEAEYNQGDFEAALSTYQLLMESDKDNELFKKGAVLCMVETGAYEEALALNVLQSQVCSRMAAEQIEAGQYDEALATITRGRGFPDSSAARNLDFNEAVAYEYKADFARALELMEAYVQKYGADAQAERELAFLRTRQGN